MSNAPLRLVIFFVRFPEPGMVKTRLAKDIGPVPAAHVYQAIAEDQAQEMRRLDPAQGWRVLLYATPVNKLAQIALWVNDGKPPVLDAFPQPEAPLGRRLAHAQHWGFEKLHADEVYFVGSDCPYLRARHLEKAAEVLQHEDAVMGRARDGGFYLLGVRRIFPEAFESVPYSQSDTGSKLAEALCAGGASVDTNTLPVLADVDVASDLENLSGEERERLFVIAQARGLTLDVLRR